MTETCFLKDRIRSYFDRRLGPTRRRVLVRNLMSGAAHSVSFSKQIPRSSARSSPSPRVHSIPSQAHTHFPLSRRACSSPNIPPYRIRANIITQCIRFPCPLNARTRFHVFARMSMIRRVAHCAELRSSVWRFCDRVATIVGSWSLHTHFARAIFAMLSAHFPCASRVCHPSCGKRRRLHGYH